MTKNMAHCLLLKEKDTLLKAGIPVLPAVTGLQSPLSARMKRMLLCMRDGLKYM